VRKTAHPARPQACSGASAAADRAGAPSSRRPLNGTPRSRSRRGIFCIHPDPDAFSTRHAFAAVRYPLASEGPHAGDSAPSCRSPARPVRAVAQSPPRTVPPPARAAPGRGACKPGAETNHPACRNEPCGVG
jgi:hypothetical protein